MRRARSAFIAPVLTGLLLACSGCFGAYSSPYGAYGNPYGGYPSPGGAPVQTLTPGGTYTPGPYSQPTPYTVPQGSGTPSTPSGNNGDGAFYNSGTQPQPYDGGKVPTYEDPNEIQFQQPVQPDNTAIDSYGSVEGVAAEVSGAAKVDLDTADFVAPALTPAFTEPDSVESDGTAPPTFALAEPDQPLPTAPYAYDADYTWLRGVLRFDTASGHWTMIYSENPAPDDEHGGKLLVADSSTLEPFKPQAVVLLRGAIDAQQSAAAGRAVFRAEVIEPVDLATP